jgi:hypothetical protein
MPISEITSNSSSFLSLQSDLDDECLDQIATALDNNSSVTSIEVTTNAIRNERLFNYLQRTRIIKTLRFAKCRTISYNNDDLERVSTLLVGTEIVNIHFQNINLSEESAELISTALEANQYIQCVEFYYNKLSGVGLWTILQAVSHHTSITELHLSDTLCSTLINEIVAFLSVNESVVHLVFIDCETNGSEMRLLCDSLQNNKIIQSLEFQQVEIGNCIGLEGASSIAALIGFNSTISDLNLSFNELGDSGATLVCLRILPSQESI